MMLTSVLYLSVVVLYCIVVATVVKKMYSTLPPSLPPSLPPEARAVCPEPDQQALGGPGRAGGGGRGVPCRACLPAGPRPVRQEERQHPHEGGGHAHA